MVADVPVNVGWLTVPAGVPVTETEPDDPVNEPFSSTPVPVNDGVDEDAEAPVMTVALPCVGSVPVDHPIVRFSEVTVAVQDGRVPTAVIVSTVVVVGVTVIVGWLTDPAGV